MNSEVKNNVKLEVWNQNVTLNVSSCKKGYLYYIWCDSASVVLSS